MIIKPLFRRNYFTFASIILVFMAIGFASTYLYSKYERSQMVIRPNFFFNHIFSELDPDPEKALEKMRAASGQTDPIAFFLVNNEGISIKEHQKILDHPLSQEQLNDLRSGTSLRFTGDNTPGARHIDIFATKNPDWFFVTEFHGLRGPKNPNLMWITLGSLACCTLISVAIALILQFSKYRQRAEEALEVLQVMRQGNLSARMPAKKFEDLGPLVQAFNIMADDIERMVENMKKAYFARRQLLQDLAHDLRTPLASLKTFLETLKHSDRKLSEEKRHEVVSLCFTEVEYFGNLVEDLLFLAQITEPKYSLGSEDIDILERVYEQVHVFKTRYPHIQFDVASNLNEGQTHLIGSTKLIDRMLRNAFENSSSFAKSKIRLELTKSSEHIQINILDDGPGFSERALKEFGYKKASRVLSGDSDNKRISVGIGSVIMREIVQLHSGELHAENILKQDEVLGSKVSLILPVV